MAALSHRPPIEDDTPSQASKTHHRSHDNHHAHHTPPLKHYTSAPRSSTSDRLTADLTTLPASSHHQRHSSTPSASSFSRSQRSATSLLSRAAAALDRTQNAFAGISEPVIRPRHSNSALARLSLQSVSAPSPEPSSPGRTAGSKAFSVNGPFTPAPRAQIKVVSPAAQANHPPSQPYSETDPSLPAPIRVAPSDKKMHQTSSRLLRMTDDDRPFTRVCFLQSHVLAIPSSLFFAALDKPWDSSLSFYCTGRDLHFSVGEQSADWFIRLGDVRLHTTRREALWGSPPWSCLSETRLTQSLTH